MKATEAPHQRGQSPWLDNITRDARRGQPPAFHGCRLADRPHLEPVDLRQGDRVGTLRLLFIKIPGTAEGLPAITECVAAGVPVNVPRWRPAG